MKAGPDAGVIMTLVGSSTAQIISPMKVSYKVTRLNQWMFYFARIPLIITVTNSFRNVRPSVCPDGRKKAKLPAGPSEVNIAVLKVPASLRTVIASSIVAWYCT
jgi:hypothetical protein